MRGGRRASSETAEAAPPVLSYREPETDRYRYHRSTDMITSCVSVARRRSESRHQRGEHEAVVLRTSCALALITKKVNVVDVVGRYNLRWLRVCVRCALTSFVLSPSGSKRSCSELPQEAEIRYPQILRQDVCRTSSSQSQTCGVETLASSGESSSKKRRWSKRRTCPAKNGPTVRCESQHC